MILLTPRLQVYMRLAMQAVDLVHTLSARPLDTEVICSDLENIAITVDARCVVIRLARSQIGHGRFCLQLRLSLFAL